MGIFLLLEKYVAIFFIIGCFLVEFYKLGKYCKMNLPKKLFSHKMKIPESWTNTDLLNEGRLQVIYNGVDQ